VRTHSEIRRCIAFVGVESQGHFTPHGTGFFGGLAFGGMIFQFLITADHLLDQIAGDSFSVRINRRSGGAECIRLPKAHAIRHYNKLNDLAIFSVSFGTDIYDFAMIELDRADLVKSRAEVWDVHLGDEVCAMGVYTSHHGLARNIPVMRVGNLAALLEEEVRGPQGGYVEAYLIELRTIAGLSGSPVFVTPPPLEVRNGQLVYMKGEDRPLLPLGVLVGYHTAEPMK
jgi:hypothetical protein